MLKEKLMQDLKDAMKEKNTIKKDTVQMVRAAILKQEQIDHKKEINDELLIDVVNKQIKMRKDSITEFEKGGRDDLVLQTNTEIAILREYLPKQLSKEEIKTIVEEIINAIGATGIKDMGPVMKEAKAKIGAGADGRTINEVVKELLQ